MSAALTPPFLVAALLVCVAGALKLRAPRTAATALRTLGLPGETWLIRGLAGGELVLGTVCVLGPSRATAAVLTGVYVTFVGVAALLSRGRVACGCFGDDEAPVSAAHWIASVVLASVAAAATVAATVAAAGPHGIGWVLAQPAPTAAALAVGIAGALYATVLVYTELPAAWAAWSGQ